MTTASAALIAETLGPDGTPARARPTPRVLFVDDESRVLNGIKRLLRGARCDWSMAFASDPRVALDILRDQPFEALVTDMRMPLMDGAELLAKARDTRPDMARIVLSGYSERAAALRAAGLAHQFLAKPCDVATLRATVSRACDLRALLHDAGLATTICRLGALPSLPKLHEAVSAETARADVSMQRVAKIVAQDLGMTAKVLQLVNSAFFGLGRQVLDIEDAVGYLGVDIIRSLVVSNAAFTAFAPGQDTAFFERLWRHSWLTALLAQRIAELESGDALLQAESFQAGILHDVGQLALAERLPEDYRRVQAPAAIEQGSITIRELKVVGADHGRVGAYLMGLWGLSDRIVEAIAYHHRPRDCRFVEITPLTTVHAANAFVHAETGAHGAAELDEGYLAALGLAGRLAAWRSEARRILDGAAG